MHLYSISDEYINFLRKKFPRVYSNKENIRVHNRKYLGVVIQIDSHKYYISLSSPKEKHDYIFVDGKRTIRKDSLIVMRITTGSFDNKVLKGTLQIGTMIPVPDSEIQLYDVKNEPDQAYKDLVNEEIIYIRKHEKAIIKNAKVLYSKRKSGETNRVVQSCLDFQALEVECDKWIKQTIFLQTQNLTIHRTHEADWKDIQKIWTDFSSSEYAQYDMPHNTNDEEVHARIARWATFADSIEHLFFSICLSDIVIGYVAFNIRENSHEIGYCFHSDYHGKGYAKESMSALFEYLKNLGITKFSAGTALNNKPSVALLKSLGFELVETEKVAFYKDSTGNDIVFEGGLFELEIK